ncbi:metallophosphoesterase [Oricola thermophila]|uniref:Serine/threonine protein phosphatase n=1 Tax=Oricola thermophila TaxID=2742145 RepID=A0A6N1V9T4_9HYPH|nr:metallophosphoesterase [Oricola thermophila]QKV17690.1 serine/threonine protein phosphatase [Oricola thermophila]
MSLLYAIGDIHGRRDLLEPLLAAIDADAAARGTAMRIVFLGDVIDRGPESRQALDLVLETVRARPGSALVLGNHEEFMLRFLGDPADRARIARHWFANGGLTTLASYGFDAQDRIDTIAARFLRDFPGHVEALMQAEWMVAAGRYCLVHGGIDPALPLSAQDPGTTRWIRDEFLEHREPLEKIVVHGHTPTETLLPEIHPNRIAIDTGAFHSGHLTCAALDIDGNAPPRFLATDDRGAAVEVSEIDPLRLD